MAGAVLVPSKGLMGGRETTYATGVGERRTIALEDGSHIDINSASRVTVRFERHARRIKMDDAQVYFDVAKDSSRPFLITAATPRCGWSAPSSTFGVDGQVAVNVQRGLVEVRPHLSSGATPFRLRPGQGLSHREGQTADAKLQTVALEEVAGWRRGAWSIATSRSRRSPAT